MADGDQKVEYATTCGSDTAGMLHRSDHITADLSWAIEECAYLNEADMNCGPHSVVQRTVGPWAVVDRKEDNE